MSMTVGTASIAIIGVGTSPGRMPASTAAGTPLSAPASDVELGIV